jgi:hypothetical protein
MEANWQISGVGVIRFSQIRFSQNGESNPHCRLLFVEGTGGEAFYKTHPLCESLLVELTSPIGSMIESDSIQSSTCEKISYFCSFTSYSKSSYGKPGTI